MDILINAPTWIKFETYHHIPAHANPPKLRDHGMKPWETHYKYLSRIPGYEFHPREYDAKGAFGGGAI